MYGEWLFESSSCVQMCLTRAVVLGEQGDLTRAVDEMCFITHWVVSYMHQLGISPITPSDRTLMQLYPLIPYYLSLYV